MTAGVALAVALEWAEDMVVVTDPDGVITYVNPAFTRIMGWPADEARGRTPAILKSGEQPNSFYSGMWGAITAGQVWKGELLNRCRDGSLIATEQVISPVRDGSRVVAFVSIARDITARRQAQREEQRAREAAEQANRAKSAFLASMSHELRTPLNAILGYTEIVEQELADAGREDLLIDTGHIRSAGKHLLAQINAVLELSTIEAGDVRLGLGPVPLADLVTEAGRLVAVQVAENRNRLSISCPPDLMVQADASRLRQVLFNLLSNAAKFTEGGEIRLDAAEAGDGVDIAVSDTGIGMEPAVVGRLLGDTFVADNVMTRRQGGVGLGLTISRRLIELMHGKLSVRSSLGQGSTFVVHLARAH